MRVLDRIEKERERKYAALSRSMKRLLRN